MLYVLLSKVPKHNSISCMSDDAYTKVIYKTLTRFSNVSPKATHLANKICTWMLLVSQE